MCSPTGPHLHEVADLSLGLRGSPAESEALMAQVTDWESRPAGRSRLEGFPRRGAPPGLGSRRTWRRRQLRGRGARATSSASSSRGPGRRPVSPSSREGLRQQRQQQQQQRQQVHPQHGRAERRRHLLRAVTDGEVNVFDLVYEAIGECGKGGGRSGNRRDGNKRGVHHRRLPERTGLPYWMVQEALRDWIGIGVMRRDRGWIRMMS
mmetsp:Transcript_23876/g.75071  ORF Transcript_23876/g.75071 Transcript_23876/m.75071 type:complete len:207 (-) Transcript_23876:131-751(-)